jgi:ABC-type multidrug transport system fused ATPase/permease subunit
LSLSFILTVTILTLVIAIIYKIIKANLGKSFDSQRTLNSLNKENKKKAKQLVRRRKFTKITDLLYDLFSNQSSLLQPNQRQIDTLSYYATRLNKTIFGVKVTFKHLYLLKCLLATLGFFVIAILATIELKFLLLLLLLPVLYISPNFVLEEIVAKKNVEIKKEFADFYSVFFYQLRHKENRNMRLKNIAESYLPRAGKEMEQLIRNFCVDCKVSEADALKNLKRNYRIPHVYRFCSIMNCIISGKYGESIGSNLTNFKNELRKEKIDNMREVLKNKKKQSAFCQYIVYIILAEITIGYVVYSTTNVFLPLFTK